MNALMFSGVVNLQKYVCAAFENAKEFVAILHEPFGTYHQHWQPGAILYGEKGVELAERIRQEFAASNVAESELAIGHVIKHVWRPGLCIDIPRALEIKPAARTMARRKLRSLVERLEEIFLCVEPDPQAMGCSGHKIRELLLLACAEVEAAWWEYMRLAGISSARMTAADYVNLKDRLFLGEYKVTFMSAPHLMACKPFAGWERNSPTRSLDWYNAYAQTKQDRNLHFSRATLEHCLKAVMANIVLFCVRYSPYELFMNDDSDARSVQKYFALELDEPNIATFYVPPLESVPSPAGVNGQPRGSRFTEPWLVEPFML